MVRQHRKRPAGIGLKGLDEAAVDDKVASGHVPSAAACNATASAEAPVALATVAATSS
jgi:hypothetical protein